MSSSANWSVFLPPFGSVAVKSVRNPAPIVTGPRVTSCARDGGANTRSANTIAGAHRRTMNVHSLGTLRLCISRTSFWAREAPDVNLFVLRTGNQPDAVAPDSAPQIRCDQAEIVVLLISDGEYGSDREYCSDG